MAKISGVMLPSVSTASRLAARGGDRLRVAAAPPRLPVAAAPPREPVAAPPDGAILTRVRRVDIFNKSLLGSLKEFLNKKIVKKCHMQRKMKIYCAYRTPDVLVVQCYLTSERLVYTLRKVEKE
jgi:hypothetical protein